LICHHIGFVQANSDTKCLALANCLGHLQLECCLPVAVIIDTVVGAAHQLESSVGQQEQLEGRESAVVVENVIHDSAICSRQSVFKQ
jgi:hypothetical protein